MLEAYATEFDAWLRAPTAPSPDPRFEVRRATTSEFDAVYELVDHAFGRPRPPAFHDWLYRRNPMGIARCWLVFEKRSGELIGSATFWPWPMARGTDRILGALDGDSAVRSDWQRQGVMIARRRVSELDAWGGAVVRLAWPNAAVSGSRLKGGFGEIALPMPRAAVPLDARGLLQQDGWPPWAARAGAAAFNALQRARRRLAGAAHRSCAVEEVRRFDTSCDALAEACVGGLRYWSPRTSTFLNWRYLDHPTRQYGAFAAVDSTGPKGYSVVRFEREKALLMELVAPPVPAGIGIGLLQHTMTAARAAGCARLECVASPRWPHWPLLRRFGFVSRPSHVRIWFLGYKASGLDNLDNWFLTAADMDDA